MKALVDGLCMCEARIRIYYELKTGLAQVQVGLPKENFKLLILHLRIFHLT